MTKASGTTAATVAVPKRIGDPSKIKHVFLLVKENRTYDQIYGDDTRGNGDPTLAQFGEKVTPNQHALAKQFGLYDNFYDVGTNSAEGHNWVMQGDNPEYTESSAGRVHPQLRHRERRPRPPALRVPVDRGAGRGRERRATTASSWRSRTSRPPRPGSSTTARRTNVDAGGDPAQLTDPAIKVNDQSPIPSLNAVSNHDSPQFDTTIPDIYR